MVFDPTENVSFLGLVLDSGLNFYRKIRKQEIVHLHVHKLAL